MQSQQSKEPEQETTSEIDLSELPQPQLAGHGWKQQGAMLTCETCPFSHASFLPSADYQLMGIREDGLPIIKKLEF